MTGAKSDYLQIARVLKSNGTEGEVLIGFRGIAPEDLIDTEPVFIEFDGLPVPFFIDSMTRRGTSRSLVRLTGVRNLEDAEELVGREIFAKADAITSYEEEEGLTLDDLEGWSLIDSDGTRFGTITGYEDIPGNPCLYVDAENGQAMVPFHEDLILAIDEESLTIRMTIPEGLV